MTLPLCLTCGHGAGQHDAAEFRNHRGEVRLGNICFGAARKSAPVCDCAAYVPGDAPDTRPGL